MLVASHIATAAQSIVARNVRPVDTAVLSITQIHGGDAYNVIPAGAVMRGVRSATISKILYPNDEPEIGKRLRLLQEHLFVTCSLQDMLRIHRSTGQPLESFHAKFAVQLNDTHPAIAVAELMRLLDDEHELSWDAAWNITRQTFAYTNHTLLPEALEKWPVPLWLAPMPSTLCSGVCADFIAGTPHGRSRPGQTPPRLTGRAALQPVFRDAVTVLAVFALHLALDVWLGQVLHDNGEASSPNAFGYHGTNADGVHAHRLRGTSGNGQVFGRSGGGSEA